MNENEVSHWEEHIKEVFFRERKKSSCLLSGLRDAPPIYTKLLLSLRASLATYTFLESAVEVP